MTISTRPYAALVFAFGSTLGAAGAQAQAFDAVRLYGAAPGTDGGSIAAVLLAGRQYQGSDERRTLVLPVLDYQWANGWFAGVSNGVGYNFSSSAQLQYGLRLTAALDRQEGRSSALRGLGDVAAKAEGGAFFNMLSPAGYFFSSSARYGAGQDGKGLLLDLGAGYATSLAPQWRLGVGAAVTVANAAYLQSYFGVTAAQSARSAYAAYTPGAGLRDARVNASLTHVLNPRTSITGAATLSSLLGDAKNSPLTRQKTTASGLLAVSYAF
jgi:outer membrane scaffolding protein for murein synthesis (MipA/OmpV family)